MKITSDHQARGAFIYIRQSTVDQLANNHESRRRQYGLADRAHTLGWTDVTVIDDDLGRSGSGVSRPGFEKLLAAICEGRVGAVFAIEVSRLARNGRDWHTLIEFCGLVGTVSVIFDVPVSTVFLEDPLRQLPEPPSRRSPSRYSSSSAFKIRSDSAFFRSSDRPIVQQAVLAENLDEDGPLRADPMHGACTCRRMAPSNCSGFRCAKRCRSPLS